MRIERDMGENSAAPKTIRFFVPYWISNDSSLSLAYQVVEIEPVDNADVDSVLLSRVKSAKIALKSPMNSMERRHLGGRKTVQVLEVIEDTSPTPCMLSPQDYASRSGVNLFPSRNEAHLSPRVGISVAIRRSENFSPGISFFELENKVIFMVGVCMCYMCCVLIMFMDFSFREGLMSRHFVQMALTTSFQHY